MTVKTECIVKIEVMTCPVGCVSGGGQPKLLAPDDKVNAYANRTCNTYVHDGNMELRKSHNNPEIQKIYREFLVEDNIHHLLHTKYTPRR